MGRVRLAVAGVEALRKSKREAEHYKKQLIDFLQRKKDDWLNKELSYSDYTKIADEKKSGRNIKEWIELYERHIEYCDKEISKQNNSLKIKNLSVLAVIIISIFSIILIAPNLNKAITGFAANINSQTLIKEIGKTFVSSENFEFIPEIEGQLFSLKITGSFSGNGNAEVYLDNIPVFLSSNLEINEESKASLLTGFTISEEISKSSGELANELSAEENNTQKESLPEQTEPNPSGQAGSLDKILPDNSSAEQTLEKHAEQEITKRHFEFSAVCEETCDLKNLNLTSKTYEIKLDISDAELTINKIEYEIAQKTIQQELNKTFQENFISEEISISQETVEIGKPVKWKGAINPKTSGRKEIEIPDSSSNIRISNLNDGKTINTELKEKRNKTVVLEMSLLEKEDYEIKYETPAPTFQETNYSENRKEIKISSPEDLHYTNVTSRASLPKKVNVDDAEKIELYWIINGTKQNHPFNIVNLDNDAIIDYIEWITPSLSEQTFEIILITNAEHLDENKSFISDIYEQVKALDGVWSEEIPENDYIRVTFEKSLTSKNDITFYPRIISGNPRIEVYEFDGSEKIAEFYELIDNKYNKIYLDNLTNSRSDFDLRVVQGSVEIEHIIDPNPVCTAGTCVITFNATNTTWTVPPEITKIKAWAVGGGGGGRMSTSAGGGGSGGDFRHSSLIAVTSGENLNITVGGGGAAGTAPTSGNLSSINRGTDILLLAAGGGAGTLGASAAQNGTSSTIGGAITGGNGGTGGAGSGSAGCGGGGGAGGWSNSGGNGGATGANNGVAGTTGGGGAGGGGGDDAGSAVCGGGGGVGIVAAGAVGAGGLSGNPAGPGKNGSAGDDGVGSAGGLYGGGGGGDDTGNAAGAGKAGAVVITYLEPEPPIFKNFKEFPSNNTQYALGTTYIFNATLNSTNTTVGIEFDGVNYTAINASLYPNVYNVSISGLSAGNHSYYWWARGNGTDTTYNYTELRYYKIDNATGNVQVYLNGGIVNVTVELGSTVTINTSRIAGEGRFTLFRDGIQIANSSGGISNTTLANSTKGINITAILEQTQNYTYNSTQRFIDVTDTISPMLKIVYPQNDSSHSGAIITVNYTVSDLDLQACWYTNSSGTFNYTITCGANLTTLEWAEGNNIVRIYANDSSGNRNMSVVNFTISLNSAPQIYAVYNNSGESGPVTLSAGPANTNITINFSVIDTNGVSDILNNTARINLTRSGEGLRYNESCSIYQSSGSQANFTCKVMLWWFDSDGLWNISINISDSAGALAYNTTTRLILNTLTGFNIGPGNLSFGALSPGSTNNTDNTNGVLLNNTGNQAVPIGGISINATNLVGETLSTKGIYSGNFSVSNTTGTNAECNVGGIGGSSPISYNMNDTSGTYANITSAFLEDGNYTRNNGTAQENLYVCILQVGSELTTQSYSTFSLGSWTIRILLVALAIRNTKKKTRLIKALGLIAAEIRENSSENKKETLKLIIQEIQENYPESTGKINSLLLSLEKVPITIFTKKLGCLEALCKYLKENKSLSYHEIAKITARNNRTIWSSYNKAISKQKEPLEIKETNEFIPLSIFSNRRFTILESIILYLRERGLKYSKISELLERDQRNIWTINSRISKKLTR